MCTEMLKECVARTSSMVEACAFLLSVLAVSGVCVCIFTRFIFYACGTLVGEIVEIFFSLSSSQSLAGLSVVPL